jgi:hypothetical protein
MEAKVENMSECEDEVIFISCSDKIPKPMLDVKTIPMKKKGRTVSLDIRDNTETLIITQKVKVNRQNIKYVINLNTNVCDNLNQSEIKSPKKEQPEYVQRFVPCCLRSKCKTAINLKIKKQKIKKTLKVCLSYCFLSH